MHRKHRDALVSIVHHNSHFTSQESYLMSGKGSFTQEKCCNKTQLRSPPLHFAGCWWPRTQTSLRRQKGPQKPGILLSLHLLCLPDPHFQRQFEKKKWICMNKNPSPPNLNTRGLSRWGVRAGKSTLTEQLVLTRRLSSSECRCCVTLHTLHKPLGVLSSWCADEVLDHPLR
jgi:hypothetical protein